MTKWIDVSVGCDMEGDYCLYIQRDEKYLTENQMDVLAPALQHFLNSDEGQKLLALLPADEEDEDEEEGDDLCDLCMTSGVNVGRTTYCGKTIGIECGCEESHGDGTCGDYDCTDCKKHRTEAR